MEPGAPALGVQTLSHWTTREVPTVCFYTEPKIMRICDLGTLIKLSWTGMWTMLDQLEIRVSALNYNIVKNRCYRKTQENNTIPYNL